MFEDAALDRAMDELSFIEIASPPASSDGLVIRLPLDNRFKLLLSISLFLDRLKAALMAAVLVFIVSDIGFILRDYVLVTTSCRLADFRKDPATLFKIIDHHE